MFLIIFLVFGTRLTLLFYGGYSFGIASFMAWVVLCQYLYQRMTYRYFGKLLVLKIEKEWWIETNHTLTCGANASRFKDTFSISEIWFILSLFISAVPLLEVLYIELKTGYPVIQFIPLSYVGILIQSLSFLCFLRFIKKRTVNYSGNTEINITINHIYQREWSKCWIITSIMISFCSVDYAKLWLELIRYSMTDTVDILTFGKMIPFIIALVLFTKLNDAKIRKRF